MHEPNEKQLAFHGASTHETHARLMTVARDQLTKAETLDRGHDRSRRAGIGLKLDGMADAFSPFSELQQQDAARDLGHA
jgi:hypothetical protein